MLDPDREPPLPLFPLARAPAACEDLAGRRVSAGQYFRWRQKGLAGVRLEAWRCGGVWCTSRRAVATFFKRLSDLEEPVLHAPREKAALPTQPVLPANVEPMPPDRARSALKRIGILR